MLLMDNELIHDIRIMIDIDNQNGYITTHTTRQQQIHYTDGNKTQQVHYTNDNKTQQVDYTKI